MARPTLPANVRQVLELRAAGHSVASITERTGLSSSTVFRHCKRHAVHRGSLSEEAIDQARQQLLDDADFVSNLKTHICSSILDDLHMSRAIKERAMLVLEELESEDVPAMIKARSLASVSTALKVASDVQRRCLRLDDPATLLQTEDLPQLTITRMSDEEIERAQHRFDEFENNEESILDEEVIED